MRLEDVDGPRCVPGADRIILAQLAACGLVPDEPPVVQSERSALYQAALNTLSAQNLAYPCACSRQDVLRALQAAGVTPSRHGELVYPGTCRDGLHGRAARACRFHTAKFKPNRPPAQSNRAEAANHLIANETEAAVEVVWQDRRLGRQTQPVGSAVGDFVLKRADGLWAYQLAVVVDDAAQGVSDIVRGEDLADNTARQILLQQALSLPTPRYLHTPLVLGVNGEKLSKQNGAQPLDVHQPVAALQQAGAVLGLSGHAFAATTSEWLQQAVLQWLDFYGSGSRTKIGG